MTETVPAVIHTCLPTTPTFVPKAPPSCSVLWTWTKPKILPTSSTPSAGHAAPPPTSLTCLHQVQRLLRGLEATRIKSGLADGKQPLNHELHTLVDLAFVQHSPEALKHAAG